MKGSLLKVHRNELTSRGQVLVLVTPYNPTDISRASPKQKQGSSWVVPILLEKAGNGGKVLLAGGLNGDTY